MLRWILVSVIVLALPAAALAAPLKLWIMPNGANPQGIIEETLAGFKAEEPLLRILAMRDQILELVKDNGLDGITLQDFPSLVDGLGAYGFFANSMVSNTVPLSMESDIHGAISAILMHRAVFAEQPVFTTEFTIRHPTDDNGVLLWHAGAPTAMLKIGAKIELGRHWPVFL